MEQGVCADRIVLPDQGDAALANDFFEVLDGLEMSIGEGFVDELPKVLCRLQLRAMGGLEYKTDTVGHAQVFGTVPSGTVELKHDALAFSCAR